MLFVLISSELVTQRKPSLQWNMGLTNTGFEKERGALMLTGLARVLHGKTYIWGKKGEAHPTPNPVDSPLNLPMFII